RDRRHLLERLGLQPPERSARQAGGPLEAHRLQLHGLWHPAAHGVSATSGDRPLSRFEHGYALLVGVGQGLKCTAADASALANLLVDPSRAAYPEDQVVLLTEADATRRNVLDALQALSRRTLADPEATVIVYYSGHGVRIGASADLASYYLL